MVGEVKGTRRQFETIVELLREGSAYLGAIGPSDFESVIKVTVEHDDQRDGHWVDTYLIGQDGDKVKIK